jgi:hypothetical protein
VYTSSAKSAEVRPDLVVLNVASLRRVRRAHVREAAGTGPIVHQPRLGMGIRRRPAPGGSYGELDAGCSIS